MLYSFESPWVLREILVGPLYSSTCSLVHRALSSTLSSSRPRQSYQAICVDFMVRKYKQSPVQSEILSDIITSHLELFIEYLLSFYHSTYLIWSRIMSASDIYVKYFIHIVNWWRFRHEGLKRFEVREAGLGIIPLPPYCKSIRYLRLSQTGHLRLLALLWVIAL